MRAAGPAQGPPDDASIRANTRSNGNVDTRKSPRNGLLRAMIRISTRPPEIASAADIARSYLRLGTPRKEPKAIVSAPPAIVTIETTAGMVVSAANNLCCLVSHRRASNRPNQSRYSSGTPALRRPAK